MPKFPLAFLIVTNMLAVAAVVAGGWNLYTLLLLYWAENGIVGLYTIPKMMSAAKQGGLGKSRSYQIIFYITHYSTFWVLHGVALVTIFNVVGVDSEGSRLFFYGLLALIAVQHAVSHRVNWAGQREFERLPATQTMVLPYVRVGAAFLLSILGGLLVALVGSPAAGVAVLAIVKLGVDAASHVYVHRTLAPRAPLLAE